jgi:hypothetical protein
MNLIGGWALPITWTLLGLTIVVASLYARRSRVAYVAGIWTVSVLWVVAGAGVNLAMLIEGSTYTKFASGSPIPFVRDTWESLVVPHHHVFIGLLIAFEAAAGLAVLWRGRARTVSLAALIAFNVTLVVFGWGFLVWAVPLVVSLVLLLRAGPKRVQPTVHQRPFVPDRDTELASVIEHAGYR